MKGRFSVFMLSILAGSLIVGTSSMTPAQAAQKEALAAISGKVKDVKGIGVPPPCYWPASLPASFF